MDSISLCNISKSFYNKIIFSNMSYDFFKKNYHLTGKNGTGKSTLLRLIVGLDRSDSGEIRIQKERVSKIGHHARQIYYVPDDLAIYPFLTGNEFFSWIANIRFGTIQEAHNIIQLFELESHLTTRFSAMSLGTKKKFILASVLIGTPDFIILDEPLNGLDKYSQQTLLRLLKEKSSNCGIIFSTHCEADISLLDPITIEIRNYSLIENY